ncbi:MAG: toll/interleukin-1 receptor domain-containing protein [Moraxellaceae bacterium]|nr:toll/interleukin-1 receptor domain-containing protein [Moraxellaceae bacterium]
MSYKYDVFFSYKRNPESDAWHQKVMMILQFWLKQELHKPNLTVFFDQEDIHTGNRWQAKLGGALKTSKVIVCIWSPLYFQSKWCVSEWKTFSVREDSCQRELIMPASFIDGESFPAPARARAFADFSHYTSVLPTFWDTQLAVNFESEYLKKFAKDLASLVRQAPPFDPNFPVVEAADNEVLSEGVIGRIADV